MTKKNRSACFNAMECKKICFLGDSITADGRYIYELTEYFSRCKKQIKLFNCGVAGGTAHDAIARINEDCLIFCPDTIYIMFGLNDIDYYLYGSDFETNKAKREINIQIFSDSLHRLCALFAQRGIEVILCTPPPYGVNNRSTFKNYSHSNEGLYYICKTVNSLGDMFSLPVININGLFDKFSDDSRLINPDRLHPTTLGHHLISQAILKFYGQIDEITMNYPTLKSQRNNIRYKEEQILRAIAFVEWYIFREKRKSSIKNCKRLAENELKKFPPNSFCSEMLQIYLTNIDEKQEHLKKLIKYT